MTCSPTPNASSRQHWSSEMPRPTSRMAALLAFALAAPFLIRLSFSGDDVRGCLTTVFPVDATGDLVLFANAVPYLGIVLSAAYFTLPVGQSMVALLSRAMPKRFSPVDPSKAATMLFWASTITVIVSVGLHACCQMASFEYGLLVGPDKLAAPNEAAAEAQATFTVALATAAIDIVLWIVFLRLKPAGKSLCTLRSFSGFLRDRPLLRWFAAVLLSPLPFVAFNLAFCAGSLVLFLAIMVFLTLLFIKILPLLLLMSMNDK